MLTGNGVENVVRVESAWGVCKKYRILYNTANLIPLLERPLAALGIHLYLGIRFYDDFSKISINLQYENYFGLLKNKVNTVSKPITNGEFKRRGLVDMEAYEICEVIKKIDDIDNLFILKIVSDFMDLDDGILSSKQVYNFIEQNLLVIDSFLNAIALWLILSL